MEREHDGDSYMSPIPNPFAIIGMTSVSIYYYTTFLLLARRNIPKFDYPLFLICLPSTSGLHYNNPN